MALTRAELGGIWAALPVAWTAADEFDEEVYRRDVEACCRAGVHGVYTGGTTGEFYAQDTAEFRAIADATIDVCRSAGTPTQIGCTMTYTRGVIERARYAQEQGADAIQIALPYWVALTDEEVIQFFADVASACPGMPMVMYDTVGRAKRSIDVDLLARIVDRVPELVGIKADTSPAAGGTEKVSRFSEYISVLVPDPILADMTPLGARGCCSAMVYANPSLILHYFELCRTGKLDQAGAIQQKLKLLIEVGLAPFTEMQYADTAYDRMLGNVNGFLHTSLHARRPYRGTCREHVDQLRGWLRGNFPEMLDLSPRA